MINLLNFLFFFVLIIKLDSFNIDYQIHSNNDLNELEQLFIKGARRFKFDPHYIEDKNACNGINQCFLLNHNDPYPTFSNYNSTADLLNFLSSSKFEELRNGEYVSIALCFKSAPNKCQLNDTSFKNWLDLVDEFYSKATLLNLNNVEFILDGDAKPINCLIGKWTPWVSVWINSDSPASAYYSNDKGNDEYRFQVLNDPESKSNWTWMKDNNYGKFSNGLYPYQLWEPDSQLDFQDYINIYQSGEVHNEEFHFAINIDIAMFQLYSNINNNTCTSPSINLIVEENLSFKPFISKTDYVNIFIYLYLKDNMFILSRVNVIDTNNKNIVVDQYIDLPNDLYSWLMPTSESKIVKFLNLNSSSYLLASNNGNIVIFSILNVMDVTNDIIFSDIKYGYSVNNLLDVHKINDLSKCRNMRNDLKITNPNDSFSLCVMFVSSNSDNNLIYFDYSLLSNNNSLIEINTNQLEHVIIPLPFKNSLSTARVIIHYNNSFLFISVNDTIYGTLVSFIKWVKLSVGSNIDVSCDNNVIMMISDNGYCYNSHKHNTRSYPIVCSTIPISTPNILDYNIGLISDWIDLFQTSNSYDNNDNFNINSCNKRILHGTYSQGSFPTLVLSNDYFIEIHQGVSPLIVDLSGCGDPIHSDGLIMNSFPIDNWLKTLNTLNNKV